MKSKFLVFSAGFSCLKFLFALLVLVFLVGCISPVNEGEVDGASAPVDTEISIPPTETMAPAATNTPMPTPTTTPAYHELTNEEKLARSLAFVDAASGYRGEVTFSHDYVQGVPFYWHPELEEWRTTNAHSTAGFPISALDVNGETLPPIAIAGIENPDGSLTMTNPFTGVEQSFSGLVFIPGFGEISLKNVMTMNRDEFENILLDELLAFLVSDGHGPGDREYEWTGGTAEHGLYMPGFTIDRVDIYATGISITGPSADVPEEKLGILEQPTNSFAIPIFSPESGEFLFFLNVQRGFGKQNLEFSYDDRIFLGEYISGEGRYGLNQEGFGILIDFPDPSISHSEGGMTPIMQHLDGEGSPGEPGIGDVGDIQRILEADTEEEILAIMNGFRMFVTAPFRVVFPRN